MISGRHNPRLQDMRRLRRSKGDRALLEGPHLVREALAAGIALETVVATPDFLAGAEGRALAAALPRPPLGVAPRLLDELADADSPRGVAAVAHLPRRGVEALPRRAAAVYLYADGLQDPGNLGALARVAEAAGAAGLALAPAAVHPNHPRALRASAGSLLRLPVAVDVSPADLDAHLAAGADAPPAGADAGPDRGAHGGPRPAGAADSARRPPRWIALVPRGGADLYAAPLDGTLVVAVGAEGPGLSPVVAARADLAVTIPLVPPVESLNAVVAAALVLFEIGRRRRIPP